MEENNKETVYVSNCGKKYHFNPQCSYIKDKVVNALPLNAAINRLEGPCSRCINYRNILLNRNNQMNNFKKNNILNNNINSNNKKNIKNYLHLKNNLNNNNLFGNNKFFQNNNQILDELNNYRKINIGKLFKINNDDEEDKKINDINNEKSIVESKDKMSDFLMLSGSGSIVAGGGFNLKKKTEYDEKSSEIDFNNNKFSTANKNIPFHLNNISNIHNFDLSNDNDNSKCLINKNERIKEEEEEDEKYFANIVKKFENNKNTENNKNFNLISKKENDKKINIENKYDNSISFNIINNQINNISNQKDENAFFSNSNISNNNEENSSNNSKIKNVNNKNIFLIYNIDNSSNNININNNKDDNNFPSSLSTQKFELKKRKRKIRINKDDLNIIKETNLNSIILSLENSFFHSTNTTYITNAMNCENNSNKIDKKKKYDENDIFKKGYYKFSFEINPKINSKICINIEVGFEIDFIDQNDNSFNEEEEIEDSLNENDDIILDSIFQKLCISRRLNIHKKTNQIYVLINIIKGKFFVIGENEFNDIINKEFINSNIFNILYISNCQIIPIDKIKDIKPIFHYNKKDLNIVEIINNGRKIEE